MARHFHSASANRRQQSNKDGGKPMQFDRITFGGGGGGGGGGRNQRCNSNRFNLLSTQKSNRKWIEFKKNSKKANVSFHWFQSKLAPRFERINDSR